MKEPIFANGGCTAGFNAWTLSDGGKSAIVETVVRDSAAVAGFRRNTESVAGVTHFERGKDSQIVTERERKKLKREYDPRKLTVRVP